MSVPPSGTVYRMTRTALRTLFNLHMLGQIERGELIPDVLEDDILSPEMLAENPWLPPGTRRQYIAYYTPEPASEYVCAVHQYLLPDGKLGGSGKPDPKELIINGISCRLEKTKGTQ